MVAASQKPQPEWNGVLPPRGDLREYDVDNPRDFRDLKILYIELADEKIRLEKDPQRNWVRIEQLKKEMAYLKPWILDAQAAQEDKK